MYAPDSTTLPKCRCNNHRNVYRDESIPPIHGQRRIRWNESYGKYCYEYFDAGISDWIAFP